MRQLLEEVVQQAQKQWVVLGTIQVVDSTHTVANVNVRKDDGRQGRGGKPSRAGE
ncbi:MAG: hypothetical protein GX601_18855 [Anaerolineales bacterium]|nr:hypothetical protein [Anaerolineales bacterium]